MYVCVCAHVNVCVCVCVCACVCSGLSQCKQTIKPWKFDNVPLHNRYVHPWTDQTVSGYLRTSEELQYCRPYQKLNLHSSRIELNVTCLPEHFFTFPIGVLSDADLKAKMNTTFFYQCDYISIIFLASRFVITSQ